MKKNLYTRLLKYTFRYKGLFSLSILGFFLFALADISAVEWLKRVIGFINSEEESILNPLNLALLLLFISTIRGVGFYIGNFFMANVGLKVVHNLRQDLIGSLPFNWVIYLPSLFKLEVDRCNSSYCSIDRYCRKPCWQKIA